MITMAQISALLGRLTSARAGYLDALNLGGSYKTASDQHWTSTRAGYIDDIKNRMPTSGTIPKTTDVPSASDYTSALATRMNTLRPSLKAKVQASGLAEIVSSAFAASYRDLFITPAIEHTLFSANTVSADYAHGVRRINATVTGDGSYHDLLNITTSGWIIGCYAYAGSNARTVGHKLTVDGTAVAERAYASLSANNVSVFLGSFGYVSTEYIVGAALYPMRFDTSLRYEGKLNTADAAVKFAVFYIAD